MHDGEDTDIVTIPTGLWWSVQTVSTVGYGDLVPRSLFGKISACCFMVFSILTFIPLLSIASDFKMIFPKNMKYYRTRSQRKQKERHKQMRTGKKGELSCGGGGGGGGGATSAAN